MNDTTKADELAAWRDNVLDVWNNMPERPEAGDLMALGNVLRDSPEYGYKRRLYKKHEKWKREYLENLSGRIQDVLREYL